MENKQLEIRKHAWLSFTTMIIAIVIQLLLISFNFDRTTRGYVNFLVFWPLCLFALIEAIKVIVQYCRHHRGISGFYLLLTLPVFGFLIYFITRLMSSP